MSPETREKVRKSLSGRTFLARGGNGKFTKQQLAVHVATGLPMEHSIATSAAKGVFQSLPNHYKVDLADPVRMLAIEVDGRTHQTKKWKFLDKRKTEVLNFLGWSVLRFTNEEVTKNLAGCVRMVESTISKLSQTTTFS
jgi:hypothetical protein